MLSRLPPTPLPATPLPPVPCCCSTSHHFTSMGNLHKMQRWPGFILCIGRTPKKVCYAQKSMLRPGTRACLSHSFSFSLTLSLSFCVCVHGYFLFCINAPQASLSLSPARQPVIDCRPQCLLQVAPLDSTPSASPSLLSVASCSGGTASAAAAATAAVADVNLLKKFRFLAFFCILADGLSLYCAGGNRFHFMLSIEFKLFGK